MPTLTVESFGSFDVAEGKRLVLAIEQDAGFDILHACDGEPPRMTRAERDKLAERGLSGVRLSCQILCTDDMAVRAISRLEGSGRPDPGRTPEPHITPPPEWT
jgi:ferredoxin